MKVPRKIMCNYPRFLVTSDVPMRRLSPKGDEHEVICQQGGWVSKGVDWEVPHQLEMGTTRTLGLEGIVRPHIDWGRRTNHSL